MSVAAHLGYLFFGSIAAVAVMLFFFSPQWVYWQGFQVREAWNKPQINRARDTLKQRDDPWVRISDPANKAIENRLLFPLVGHVLGLRREVFLAIPLVGCWLVALALLDVFSRRTADRWLAFCNTMLLCSTSWFFVSTGWLAYFDSWYVLALLVVACYRSRWLLACCCLLAPWVDERFVVGLPLALMVRSVFWQDPGPVHFCWKDALFCGICTLPFVGLRLILIFARTEAGTDLGLPTNIYVSPIRYLEGAWSGFRAIWWFILIYFCQAWTFSAKKWCLALGVVAMATLALNFYFAGDLSRGVMGLMPLAVLSLVPSPKRTRRATHVRTLVVLAANLLLPAEHVVTTFNQPIHGFVTEWKRWNHPAPFRSFP